MARHTEKTIEVPRELPTSLRGDARALGCDPSHLSKVRRGIRQSVSLTNRDKLLQQVKRDSRQPRKGAQPS